MKRIVFIVLVSVLLVTGSVHLERCLVSLAESLFWQLIPISVAGPEYCLTEPPSHQPTFPTSDPIPEFKRQISPEATPKNCFYCDNSRQCQNCDGFGIEFGPRFGIYSGYGMDTLMDRLCFMCDGLGVCSFCS